MTKEVDIPTFEVKASGGPFVYPELSNGARSPDGCILTFKCPKCNQKNSHGGVYKKKGEGDGHRVSHCSCWPNGYYLREI